MAMLEAFSLELSLWEILVRGTIIYLAIAVIIRFIPKRHTGSMSPNDIIALVLVGDLAGYAMVGETTSAPDVLLMIVVVLVWSYLFNVLEYYFPRLRSIDQHSPTLLIHNGQLLKANLAKEKLTEEELSASLRKQGVADISCVKLAILEVDGKLSVVRKD